MNKIKKLNKITKFFLHKWDKRVVRDNWATFFYEFIDSYEREYGTSSDDKKIAIDAYVRLLKAEIEYNRVTKLFNGEETNHFIKWLETITINLGEEDELR